MSDKSQNHIGKMAGHNTRPTLMVSLMAAAWALTFSVYSSFLHEVFRSTSFDMALHSQILWNLANGRFMQTSFMSHPFAGNHFWPGFYLLLPVYQSLGIHGILALQSLTISSGAFAAFLLARDITASKAWGYALALAYLLQPTLSIGVLFDYHLELFSVPLALFALLGLRRNRMWFWPCLALSVSFYEIVAVVFFFVGAGLLLVRGRRRTGAFIALICLAYIAIVCMVVMPHFRENIGIPHWHRYGHLGNTFAQAIASVLLHPFRSAADSANFQEAFNLSHLLIAFGFLPLLSLRHLLPALPLLFVLFLSKWGINSDIRYGYVAPALPFLVLSAAHGAARLKSAAWLQRAHLSTYGPYALIACSIFLFFHYQTKRPLRREPFAIRKNIATLRAARDLVPEGAALSADNHLGAHFANRNILLVTPATKRNSTDVDFVLTDLNEKEFKNSQWWVSMNRTLTNGQYGPVFFSNDVLLLQKNVTNQSLTRSVLDRIETKMPGSSS